MVVHILCVSGIFVYLTSLLAYLCFSFLNIMVRHLSRIIFIHQTSDSCIQKKIYQHKVISHPVYKGLQFSIGARVYYFIIKGLNSGKRCPVTVNVLGNLITPIKKKKEFNFIAATGSWAYAVFPVHYWPELVLGGTEIAIRQGMEEEMSNSAPQCTQVNTVP